MSIRDELTPLFSVIVPSYNRGGFIRTAIDSVLGQTFRSFEVLVIDDGSTDNTAEIVKAINDQRIKFFRIENSERGAARNYGVSMSLGEYITFLDSDDLFKPDHLSIAHHYLSLNPDWKVFHLGYDVVSAEGKVIYPWRKLPSPVNKKLAEGNYLSCLGIFLKREVISSHPFNENRELSGSEDYELWLRIAARFSIFTCPESSAYLVQHSSRSVLGFSGARLIKRIELLQSIILHDRTVTDYYGPLVKVIIAYLDVYLALHLLLSFNSIDGIKKLGKAFSCYPLVIFNYRFWTVLKKLF